MGPGPPWNRYQTEISRYAAPNHKQAVRIPESNRVISHVRIEVDTALESDRVLADKPADLGVVVSCSVVVKTRSPDPTPVYMALSVRLNTRLDKSAGLTEDKMSYLRC